MRRGLVAAVILLSVSVPHAQDNPDPFDPAAAVPKAWAVVSAAIEKGSVAEQLDAIRALAIARTPRALDLFERIAREGPPPVRKAAIWYLPQENRDKSLQLVLEAVEDPDLEVRREAIHSLRWFRGPRALLALQNAIMRGDADTIESAVGSARLIGSSTFEVLVEGVEKGNERARRSAITTINVLVSPRPRRLPTIWRPSVVCGPSGP